MFRNDDPRDDESESEYWFIITISTILSITAAAIIVTMLSGCSVKICSCNTDEAQQKRVDRNSTNVEFDFTPSGR